MLPKNLKYGSKVESAVARSSRVNIAPQNGTGNYGLGDTIILNLPTRNNLVLAPTESYLKFNCTVTALANNNVFRWDSCGVHGLIQRIRIFHGSNLLQDIDNYGLLAKMLFDLQQPTDAIQGKQTMLSGTRSDMTLTTSAAGYVQNAVLPVYSINSGERIGGDLKAVTATNATITETYCLNLISLIGSLSNSNYIPLFAMTSAPLRVEIQLVDTFFKACSDMTCTSAANSAIISLKNVEYVANFIELGDSAMSIIYGSLEGQPLQYVIPDFRNYQFGQQLQTTPTQVVMPIPAKFSSLKTILATIRQKGTGAATGFFPFSSTKTKLLSYQFRVGSQILPPKQPATACEFFAEALKALGSIGDINYQPSIDKITYSADDPAASTAESATSVSAINSGSFFIGLDLENYSAAPKDTIFAGFNTNTDDIFLIMDFDGQGSAVTTRFDAYANFDSVLVCENGNAYIKF